MSKIAKNTSFLFISHAIGKAFAFGILIILPRYLGEGGFGRYFFAISFASLIWSLVELGMQAPLTREIAREIATDTSRVRVKRLISNAISIELLLSAIAFIFIVAFMKWFNYPKETVIVVYLMGISELFNAISYMLRAVFRAFERMEYEGLSVLIERGTVFFIGGTLVVLGYDLMTFCVAVLGASFLSLLVSVFIVVWKFCRVSLRFEREIWVDLLKKSLPFALGNILSMLYFRIDTIMLSKLSSLGEVAVGWYGTAYSLIMASTVLPGALSGAIFPSMARSFNALSGSAGSKPQDFQRSGELGDGGDGDIGELRNLYTNSLRLMFIFGFPMGVLLWVGSDEVVNFLYPSSKFSFISIEAVSSTLKILVWAGVLLFLNFVLITLLRAADKRVAFSLIIGATAILNIVVNLILIPKYNQLGSAIAMVSSESFFFIAAFSYIWFKVCRPYSYSLKSAVKVAMVSILVGAVLSSIKGVVSPILLIAASMVFYGAIVGAFVIRR